MLLASMQLFRDHRHTALGQLNDPPTCSLSLEPSALSQT